MANEPRPKKWQRQPGFYKELGSAGRIVQPGEQKRVTIGGRTFDQIVSPEGETALVIPDGMKPEEFTEIMRQGGIEPRIGQRAYQRIEGSIDWKKNKRQPTLYDTLMANPNKWHPGIPELPRDLFRQAQRYVFDVSASRLLSHLINKTAPLIMREYEFARPPYPVMWVEMDFDALALADPVMAPRQDATADKLVGYFIHGTRAYMAFENKSGGYGFVPYWFVLHKSLSFEQELERAQYFGTSRLMFQHTLLGDVGLNAEWWRSPDAKIIARNIDVEMSRAVAHYSAAHRLRSLEAGAGSVKQLIGLLLMLTRPGQRVIQLGSEPVSHMLIKGKRAALAPHHKVTVHLSHDKAVKRILNSMPSGRHPRHHNVRGGWAQTRRGAAGNCTHDWEPVNARRYKCLKCGGTRWWRKNHTRGDIKLGRVTHEYDVTK